MFNNHKSLFAQLSNLIKIPGNKAPIVRLCLVAATFVLGLALTVLALPTVSGGLGDYLIAILTGVIITIMASALIWGFAKWAIFIFPKTKALAKRFWNSLIALGIIGLVIKVMVWLWLCLLPIPLFGLILTPLYLVIGALSMMQSEILSVMILTLLTVGTLAFMILLDVCHLMNLNWKQILHAGFNRIRSNICAKGKA